MPQGCVVITMEKRTSLMESDETIYLAEVENKRIDLAVVFRPGFFTRNRISPDFEIQQKGGHFQFVNTVNATYIKEKSIRYSVSR